MEPESEFDRLQNQLRPSATDRSNAELEAALASLSVKIREERYMWSVVVMLLIDFLMFERFSNWGAPIAILAIEALLLIMLARWCKVPDVVMLIDRIIEFYGGKKIDRDVTDRDKPS